MIGEMSDKVFQFGILVWRQYAKPETAFIHFQGTDIKARQLILLSDYRTGQIEQ